jgi:hypothetical protein
MPRSSHKSIVSRFNHRSLGKAGCPVTPKVLCVNPFSTGVDREGRPSLRHESWQRSRPDLSRHSRGNPQLKGQSVAISNAIIYTRMNPIVWGK